MRPAMHDDAVAAATALLAIPARERRSVLARMMREADVADQFFRRTGKAHSAWGEGSLMAVARRRPRVARADPDEAEAAIAIASVYLALARRALRPEHRGDGLESKRLIASVPPGQSRMRQGRSEGGPRRAQHG